ncbi:MAG: hypothetical protein IJY85_03010 [Ruminococcus sp.]|nr:hypothetical protein [Ruminococcus sp.]
MKQNGKGGAFSRKALRIISTILLILLAVFLTVYSVLSLLFGLQLRDNLEAAQADCIPITVEVEQVRRADHSRYWYAVVLRVADALPSSSSAPPAQKPGQIYATTLNGSLAAGQKLTAYYNETTREVELVDFALTEPMLTAAAVGLTLDAVILVFLLVRLVMFLRRRKKMNAPVDADLYA